jgi:hypothetical protein
MSALHEVHEEIIRARAKHGEQNFHSAHEGFAVLDEERDELWDEVKMNPLRYHAATDNDARALHRSYMRKEAIQLAAMAVRFIVEVCHE